MIELIEGLPDGWSIGHGEVRAVDVTLDGLVERTSWSTPSRGASSSSTRRTTRMRGDRAKLARCSSESDVTRHSCLERCRRGRRELGLSARCGSTRTHRGRDGRSARPRACQRTRAADAPGDSASASPTPSVAEGAEERAWARTKDIRPHGQVSPNLTDGRPAPPGRDLRACRSRSRRPSRSS